MSMGSSLRGMKNTGVKETKPEGDVMINVGGVYRPGMNSGDWTEVDGLKKYFKGGSNLDFEQNTPIKFPCTTSI